MHALPAGPEPAPRRQMLVGATFAAMAIVMLVGGQLAVCVGHGEELVGRRFPVEELQVDLQHQERDVCALELHRVLLGRQPARGRIRVVDRGRDRPQILRAIGVMVREAQLADDLGTERLDHAAEAARAGQAADEAHPRAAQLRRVARRSATERDEVDRARVTLAARLGASDRAAAGRSCWRRP